MISLTLDALCDSHSPFLGPANLKPRTPIRATASSRVQDVQVLSFAYSRRTCVLWSRSLWSLGFKFLPRAPPSRGVLLCSPLTLGVNRRAGVWYVKECGAVRFQCPVPYYMITLVEIENQGSKKRHLKMVRCRAQRACHTRYQSRTD
jgi:hypothetical protein